MKNSAKGSLTSQKGNVVIILSLAAALVLIAVVYFKASSSGIPQEAAPPVNKITKQSAQPTSTSSAEQTKIFKSSKVMKFSIELPANYNVEEKFGAVTISASLGEITINKIGTNFDNLKSFLNNLKDRNKEFIPEEKMISINGLDAVIWRKKDEKLYIIYRDNNVYTISTKTQSLYSELDKIAQSFRYIP